MKHLRRTIRKIILENIGEYDKLVKMLCSENIISINQALELAEALGFVTNVEYENSRASRHIWSFEPTEEFMSEIEAYWSTKTRARPSYSDSLHSIFPSGSTGKVKILLGDNRG